MNTIGLVDRALCPLLDAMPTDTLSVETLHALREREFPMPASVDCGGSLETISVPGAVTSGFGRSEIGVGPAEEKLAIMSGGLNHDPPVDAATVMAAGVFAGEPIEPSPGPALGVRVGVPVREGVLAQDVGPTSRFEVMRDPERLTIGNRDRRAREMQGDDRRAQPQRRHSHPVGPLVRACSRAASSPSAPFYSRPSPRREKRH